MRTNRVQDTLVLQDKEIEIPIFQWFTRTNWKTGLPDVFISEYPMKGFHVHYFMSGGEVIAHIKNEKTRERAPFKLSFSELQSKILEERLE